MLKREKLFLIIYCIFTSMLFANDNIREPWFCRAVSDVQLHFEGTETIRLYDMLCDYNWYIVCEDTKEANDISYALLMNIRHYNNKVGVNKPNMFPYDNSDVQTKYKLGDDFLSLPETYIRRLIFLIEYYGEHEDKRLENINSASYNKMYFEKDASLRNKIYYTGEVRELIESIPKGNFLKLLKKYKIKVSDWDKPLIGYDNPNEWMFNKKRK